MIVALLLAWQAAPSAADMRRAERVLAAAPVIDGHNDLAWELRDKFAAKVERVDLTKNQVSSPTPLQTDLPRLKAGRVGGQFWSLWIPRARQVPVPSR